MRLVRQAAPMGTAVNPDDRVTYAQAVWSAWQDKAGSKRDMTSSEFWIVSKWMDRSLPLPIVLRGIHEFDGTPRRLEAVMQSVERAYAYYRQAMGLTGEVL
jgi:hypothetical protein